MTAAVCLSDSISLCEMIDDLVFMCLQAFALDVPLAWNTVSSLQGWLLRGQII